MLYDDYEYLYEWEQSKSLNSIKSTTTTNSATSGHTTAINRYGSASSDTEDLAMAINNYMDSSPILKRFERSHSVSAGNERTRGVPSPGGGEYRTSRKGISLKKLKKWYSGTQGSDNRGAGWSPRLNKRRLKKSLSLPDTTVHLVLIC